MSTKAGSTKAGSTATASTHGTRDPAGRLSGRGSWRARLRIWGQRNFAGLILGLLIFLFISIFFSPFIFITVPAGYGGVMWWRFFGGTVTSWTFGEGMKIIPPWDELFVYDTRLRQIELSVDALSSDGLLITIDVAARYRLVPENLGYLHKHVGPDYQKTLVIPEISNEIRQQIAKYSPEALYSGAREKLEYDILTESNSDLNRVSDNDPNSSDFLELEDILIRGVRLPDTVAQAISEKNVQLHRMEQYQYILRREEMESKRKAIEAEGIKQFQDTVSAGINDNYLRWKGIDATLKLAESNNAKMVIIGNQDGLPLILGNWSNDASSANGASVSVNDMGTGFDPEWRPMDSEEKASGMDRLIGQSTPASQDPTVGLPDRIRTLIVPPDQNRAMGSNIIHGSSTESTTDYSIRVPLTAEITKDEPTSSTSPPSAETKPSP
ncbi:MAG: prohibitin family protein [Rhodospirillum sp.]|nr:prohibitin family protein [Rhodospirillum sp.]MCF8487786.1 prohibitin family protein [Rhodospirillum sp.]MCF8502237.1 prohibitin family protein [Rhodospirillum sp.]